MNRYRHRRLRNRIAILAITAMLWSQALLAWHPGCSMGAMALAEIAVPATVDVDCHHPEPSSESTLCSAHCGQSDQNSEVGRIPPVHALAPPLAIDVSSIVILEPNRGRYIELPPPIPWHRPTLHPANLLLI